MKKWYVKEYTILTLADALEAFEEGFNCICKSGGVSHVTEQEHF